MSITRAAGLLDKVYDLLKLRHQNFLINYMGVSVYHHLNVIECVSTGKLGFFDSTVHFANLF